MVERAGEVHPLERRARRGDVGLARIAVEPVEEGREVAQLPARAPLQLAAASRDLARLRQVAVGERRHQAVQGVPVGAEADHAQPRVGDPRGHARPGGHEQVDALGDDQLADVGDDPVAARIQRAQGIGGAGLRAPARLTTALQAVGQRTQALGGLRGRSRPEAVHVHARRAQAGACRKLRVSEHLPKALGGVPRAHQHAPGLLQALARQGKEAVRMRAHQVLQRAAVDLDRVGDAASDGPREDGRPRHEVVGQGDVDLCVFRHLAYRGHVGVQVALEAGVVEVGERDRVEMVVGVGHVHGQHPADVRHVDGAAHGLPERVHPHGSAFPAADRVHERQLGRLSVLAQEVHLVAQVRERPRERGVVDVAAGAA